MEKMELSEALKANASVVGELMFKYTPIARLADFDNLLWNKTNIGNIYTFNSPADYDSSLHPFAVAGSLEVRRFGGSSTMQILYDINCNLFIRRKVGEESWTVWKQV